MQPHEIVSDAMANGLADKLATHTRKSAELFRSHGRPPKTQDYAHGTGNVSPVTHYINYVGLWTACDLKAALRLHEGVTRELYGRWAIDKDKPLRDLLNGILTKATQIIVKANLDEISEGTDDELTLLDSKLGKLESEASNVRARVRAELRSRESQRLRSA